MGFSLEPHQEAYEAALETQFVPAAEQAAQNAADRTAFDALRKQCENAFMQEDGAALLAQYRAEQTEADAAVALLNAADAFHAAHAPLAENLRKAISFSSLLFWCMAFLVGTVQGGIQAVSRSYFGKLVPKDRSNEFFGFFDIFGKFASVLGPVLYSLLGGWTGRSSYGVLCLSALFLAGFFILLLGKKQLAPLENGAASIARE